ncbi:hypothetical protein MKW94_016355 [Papaver nudicaule]|uniref:histone acetyltransferase n=1 Tax=Papaver nudicaule TaxID=74823 RepID=A0AA41S133_PAPNU|nr:hypothetical protein [Papaver nudicaule]
MEVITQSTPPLREPHTYCCSTGQPTCKQEYPNQQFSVQGVPPKNNSGPVAADRPEWLISSVNLSSNSSLNCDDYRQFQNNQPRYAKQNYIQSQALSKVSCNGNAVNSRESVDESATASKTRKTINRTRKVGGQTGDILPALEVPSKRRKICGTSNFPSPISITDHQLSEEMRPQQCPRMSYESSVTEEDEHCDSALSRELVGSNKPEPELNSIIHEGRPVEENTSVDLNTEDLCSKYKITEPDIHTEIPITGDDRRGASLTEMFTKDQLEVHLASLKEWRGETQQKVDEKRAMTDFKNDNACQLCGVERLLFAVRCFWCGILFKKMDTYHTASKFGVGCRCCNKCFEGIEAEKISVPGLQLDKEKISLDTEPSYQEPFVQCDTCERWQHYACALFNNERNFKGEAAYICPKCYIQDFKDGRRVPLAQGVIRGATDLPRTELSDHIEARLSARLKQEQDDRAKLMGMKPDEVILLFQKIDGVDVCLFGMYVQEYGSKGAHPNQRCIYMSYLDSVRYFKPDDVIAATGEPLRTFVYHEILVGYLDYCKKRGFSRCYVWSCPPAKGDLYIFNCRPEIQGSPTPRILREWFVSLFFWKAKRENIVARVTNYHDYHFKSPDVEHKVKAACLPCFDGDYLPLTAEAVLKKETVHKKFIVKPQSVRKTRKKQPSFEAVGCTDASGDPPLDNRLIKAFGKALKKQRENFIMVELGTQHMAEDIDQEEDEVIEGKIFDGREIFLAFCRENDYQFDNLQRAKHATMMFLYHLHHPSAFDEKKEEKKPNPDTGQEEVGPQGK